MHPGILNQCWTRRGSTNNRSSNEVKIIEWFGLKRSRNHISSSNFPYQGHPPRRYLKPQNDPKTPCLGSIWSILELVGKLKALDSPSLSKETSSTARFLSGPTLCVPERFYPFSCQQTIARLMVLALSLHCFL